MKTKVLIVDEASQLRTQLQEVINTQPDMEVVGATFDPVRVKEMLQSRRADVLILDVAMPKMDGLDFLEKLMRLDPAPVVIASSHTKRSSDIVFRALEAGAFDFVIKPAPDNLQGVAEYGKNIIDQIRWAARVKLNRGLALGIPKSHNADVVLAALSNAIITAEKMIIVGASTGGTEAIKEFLIRLPVNCPGILVTQHMPETFTKSFADRLDSLCKITVKEAKSNERILPGHAYIAPGHSHLLLKRSGLNYMTELSQGPPVNRHKPSVDVLFRSAANSAGKNAIGVILTGMGKDGALGLREMKQAGAYTFAQDEATCVVYGMPKEAVAVGGVDEIVALPDMAKAVMSRLAMMGVFAVKA